MISCLVIGFACGESPSVPVDASEPQPDSTTTDSATDSTDSARADSDVTECPEGPETVPRFDPAYHQAPRLALGQLDTVYDASATGEIAAQVGPGFGVDTVDSMGRPIRRVLAAFSEHDDVANVAQIQGVMLSGDAGDTFAAYRSGEAIPPLFAIKLRDGRTLSVDFVPHARTNPGDTSVLRLGADVSIDDGASWSATEVELTFPPLVAGFGRPSGHFVELGDGTILLPYYMQTVGSLGGEALLLASEDGGATFQFRSRIATPPAGHNYSEPDVVVLPDGSLYSVFRHHDGDALDGLSLEELLETRSSDEGRTWSSPQPARIAFGDSAPAPREGINPQLHLLPNGLLILSSGRPDNFVSMASDATYEGVAWEQALVSYVNYPRMSTRFSPAVQRVHGSSGNTGLVQTGPNRLIQIGDNCAAGWGCPAEDSGHDIDGAYRVWRRYVEAVSAHVGKVDLGALVDASLVTVSGNMDWTSPSRPRTNASGAFDGSTEPWSSAIHEGGTGVLEFAFRDAIELTRVGLALRRGQRATGRVEVSLDGVCWAPVVEHDTTSQALHYVDFDVPLRARFVRVQVDDEECNAEVGAQCAILSEVELYTTVNSFENEAINSVPRGYSAGNGVWVTAAQSGVSGRALRITDNRDDQISRALWTGTPSPDKRLAFSFLPIEHESAFLFGVYGVDVSGDEVPTYHLGVFADGSIRQYTDQWHEIGPSGTITLNRLHSIDVNATLESAEISIDGESVATVPPSREGAVALDRHAFSSAGTVPVGGHFVIDDVYFH